MKTQVYDQNKMPCLVPNKVAVPDKTLENQMTNSYNPRTDISVPIATY